MSTMQNERQSEDTRKERVAPEVPPAEDLNSFRSVLDWFDRFYQTEVTDALDRFCALRKKGPVVHGIGMDFGECIVPDLWGWHGKPSAMTLTYDAAATVLQDPERFNHALYAAELGEENPLFIDGEPHQQFRRMVLAAFGPRAVKRWEEVAKEIANELVDGFVDKGEADLVTQYSAYLPGMVFGRFMDLPAKDYDKVAAWAVRQMNPRDEQGLQAVTNLGPYFALIIEARRKLSEDELAKGIDIASLLASVELDGRRFSDVEINTVMHVLLIGGTDTVYKGLAASLFRLMTENNALQDVAANRDLIPALCDEAIRLGSPNVFGAARRAAIDTEVEGIPIAEGTAVIINISMANRDETKWDNAWAFDLHRPRRASMAYGTGAHICLGMHLARIIMHAGVEVLLDRLPNIRLDTSKPAPMVRGVGTLFTPNVPVLFD